MSIIPLISEDKDLIDLAVQVMVILIPIILTWIIANYVKLARAEKRLNIIVELADAAVGYAQDLDERGALERVLDDWRAASEVKTDASKGVKKLNLAAKWLRYELRDRGIKMTDEEAQRWIASEFQKRARGIRVDRNTTQPVKDVIEVLNLLSELGPIELSASRIQNGSQVNQVKEPTVDILEPDEQDIPEIVVNRPISVIEPDLHQSSDPSVNSIRSIAPLLSPSSTSPVTLTLEQQLEILADEAIYYVESLKTTYELTLPEIDIAAAWVLTEVTKRGLAVTTNQIAYAVQAALAEQNTL